MENLTSYLNESIGNVNESNLLSRTDPKITEIRNFIKAHYACRLRDLDYHDGIIDVHGDLYLNYKNITGLTSLTNGLFEFGVVDGRCELNLQTFDTLPSLIGGPKEVGGIMNIRGFESLEGAPKKVGYKGGGSFIIDLPRSCTDLKGLENVDIVDEKWCDLVINSEGNLKSLKHLPIKVRHIHLDLHDNEDKALATIPAAIKPKVFGLYHRSHAERSSDYSTIERGEITGSTEWTTNFRR